MKREQAGLRDQASDLRRQRDRVIQDLADVPRWRRSRRADLAGQLQDAEQSLMAATGRLADLNSLVATLQADVSVAARQQPNSPKRSAAEMTPTPDLDGMSLLELLAHNDAGAGRQRQPAPPRVTTPSANPDSGVRRGPAPRR